MSRTAWIALTAAALVTAIAVGVGALLVDGGSTKSSPPPASVTGSSSRSFSLPLAESPSALTLAEHRGNLLVGIAARPHGPIEVAALRAEKPVPTDALRVTVNGREVEAQSCGRGCSRIPVSVLDGRLSFLSVRVGSSAVSFGLPARLPPSGTKLFARAQRTMGSLRSFRFTERLSSGQGAVVTNLDVQAPDRLRLRTSGGYRSVIIGHSRWDNQGAGWDRGPFPGLNVAGVLVWFHLKHPRILSRGAGGVWKLAAFGLKPVPAWFRLDVDSSGRVLDAEMLAASHFMLHRYRDFNGPISITPPVRR